MRQWRTLPRCWLIPSPAHSVIQGAKDAKTQETTGRSQAREGQLGPLARQRRVPQLKKPWEGRLPTFPSAVAILLLHDCVKGSSDHFVSSCSCKHKWCHRPSGTTGTRASPMPLTTPKKDFSLGLPKFPFPILLYAHGMNSQVVAGIYTKPVCEHRTRMGSAFLPLTHWLSKSTQIFVQFLMKKNYFQV